MLDEVNEAEDITEMLKSFKMIKRVVVYKKDGSIIFTYSSNHKKFKVDNIDKYKKREIIVRNANMYIFNPLEYKNTKFGYMLLVLKTKTFKDILIDDLPLLFVTIFVTLFISFFLSHYYSKIFTTPITELAQFLETLDLADIKECQIKNSSKDDEFSILFKSTNKMIKRIQEANQKQKIASVAFDIENGMIITDNNFKIININKSYKTITGYSDKDVVGKTPPVLKKMDKERLKKIKDTLSCSHYWSGEAENIKKSGEVFIEHLTIHPVLDREKRPTNYILSFLDITKQKKTEEKLKFLQEYDALTGLPNKSLSLEIVGEILKKNEGALYCIDIKRFKEINSAYGYETGDKLLKEFSAVLRQSLKKATLIGRIENNKFLVFYTYKNSQPDMLTVKFTAQKIISLLSKTYSINNHSIRVNIATGIELCEINSNASSHLDRAILALEEAKNNPSGLSFYDKKIQNTLLNQLELYNELLMAMINSEFELYYQLQYNDNKKPYAAEALARWMHPSKGLIYPGVFIPVMEKTGLIEKFDNLILKLVCEQLESWNKNLHMKDISVSVNIGATHFNSKTFTKEVEETIKRYNFSKERLKIEITEYSMIEDIESVSETMQRLKNLGIQISLDDFGTGFSSLQYLTKLPLDQIKIDQTFIKDMTNNEKNLAIVKSILLVCNALNLEVVAEGVETKEHFELLKKLYCEHYQGYYFAKPKPVEEIEKTFSKT